jgi:cytochrome bd-type quinol oxidase subunit 2
MRNKSSHILNASSNLLGICFIVITSLKVLKKSGETIIDDAAILALLLFMASCIFSFLSIRNENARGERFEKIADYIFLAGLILLFLTTLLFSLNVID